MYLTGEFVTKCHAVKYRSVCQDKDTCVRYLCKPADRQEYFHLAPFLVLSPDGLTVCHSYIKQEELF